MTDNHPIRQQAHENLRRLYAAPPAAPPPPRLAALLAQLSVNGTSQPGADGATKAIPASQHPADAGAPH